MLDAQLPHLLLRQAGQAGDLLYTHSGGQHLTGDLSNSLSHSLDRAFG